LPKHLYVRLRRIATVTHRPVEEILSTTIDVVLPEDANLSNELADELAAMALYSDQALWAATESSITPAQQRRLEQLTDAGGFRSLTAAESAELSELLDGFRPRNNLFVSRQLLVPRRAHHRFRYALLLRIRERPR
jgi:hypothetical protein